MAYNIIMHEGVGHEDGGHSGRYPYGSGERPFQNDPTARRIAKMKEREQKRIDKKTKKILRNEEIKYNKSINKKLNSKNQKKIVENMTTEELNRITDRLNAEKRYYEALVNHNYKERELNKSKSVIASLASYGLDKLSKKLINTGVDTVDGLARVKINKHLLKKQPFELNVGKQNKNNKKNDGYNNSNNNDYDDDDDENSGISYKQQNNYKVNTNYKASKKNKYNKKNPNVSNYNPKKEYIKQFSNSK